jgi:DNA-binding NtrC family response regulator/CHASE2 domain-containing sensor protein
MHPRTKHLAVGIVVAIAAFAATLPLSGMFDALERSLLTFKYHARGESPIDTSIVVLYFDNDAISALGGLPLKRSYYALVIDALHDLGARVIGVDIGLSESDRAHPEYDHLLAALVRKAGNVVLGGYFRSLGEHATGDASGLPEHLKYPYWKENIFDAGSRLELPFPELLDGAAAFGHTNITIENKVPLFVVSAGRESNAKALVAAFPFEVWRKAQIGLSQGEIHGEPLDIRIKNENLDTNIPIEPHGYLLINFTGGANSLHAIPVVRFLQLYDASRSGMASSPPPPDMKDKIVLLGIVAEGRSTLIETPFSDQFPLIGIHATFIDNLIHQTFLRPLPGPAEQLLTLVVGLLAAYLMFLRREAVGLTALLGLISVLLGASFVLFSFASYLLPVAKPIFTMGFVLIALLIYKHQSVKGQVLSLSKEKERVVLQLQERESTLKSFEAELAISQTQNAEGRTAGLLEEVRRIKEEVSRLKAQEEDLRPFTPLETGGPIRVENFNGIIHTSSGLMADVVGFVKKIADNDATVLILGESGTGKELIARALHNESRRRRNAFIAVNCGALTETLLESELFGHERGAFTGALKEKPGRFELANGGTIFLDEIAETSEAFQVKLLRVLQEGTFERVGGTETKKADVRILAATNRELKQMVEQKKFREDLFYRLNVLTIQLPVLRQRLDDIPPLVEHFISLESPALRSSAAVMHALQQHTWQGNVRELQSAVKHAVLLAKAEERDILRLKDFPEEITAAVQTLADIEARIVQLLREKKFSRNAISETADDLGGLNRGTVAEYFRGYCFKVFVETNLDLRTSIRTITGPGDEETAARVLKKFCEYVNNAVEFVNRSQPLEQSTNQSRPKYKNLPQRYHSYLDRIIESYHEGDWTLIEKAPSEKPIKSA